MSEETTFAIGVPGLEPDQRDTSRRTFFLHLCAALAGFIGPGMLLMNQPCRNQGQLTACKSNCKNLATALEMYASDNAGRYPATLDKLIPGYYLKAIPTCPSAGRATYVYHGSSQPDSFRFACAGNNHVRAYTGFTTSSNNFPRYSAERGLIDHP